MSDDQFMGGEGNRDFLAFLQGQSNSRKQEEIVKQLKAQGKSDAETQKLLKELLAQQEAAQTKTVTCPCCSHEWSTKFQYLEESQTCKECALTFQWSFEYGRSDIAEAVVEKFLEAYLAKVEAREEADQRKQDQRRSRRARQEEETRTRNKEQQERTKERAAKLAAKRVETLKTDPDYRGRVNQLGNALLRYEREQGSLPYSLDALVPNYIDDVQLDPFTNEPFTIQDVIDGFSHYRDHPPERPTPKEMDLAFERRRKAKLASLAANKSNEQDLAETNGQSGCLLSPILGVGTIVTAGHAVPDLLSMPYVAIWLTAPFVWLIAVVAFQKSAKAKFLRRMLASLMSVVDAVLWRG